MPSPKPRRRREPTAPTTIDRGVGITPLGDAVRRYISAAGLGQRRKDAAVYAAWDDAVGPELARTARATSFSKGQLVVEVASSALLQELVGFNGEDLKQRANALLDRPHIRRVTFRLRRRT